MSGGVITTLSDRIVQYKFDLDKSQGMYEVHTHITAIEASMLPQIVTNLINYKKYLLTLTPPRVYTSAMEVIDRLITRYTWFISIAREEYIMRN